MNPTASNPSLSAIIKSRRQAKVFRENQQRKLLPDEEIFAASILDKLTGRFVTWSKVTESFEPAPQLRNFARCGQESIYRTCKDCGQVEEYAYRCNIKWCPRCQWRIAARRQELIAAWAKTINQPKHIVTTQRNFPVLTPSAIRGHQKNLAKLRRTLCWERVEGGCVSIEITNEGNGWHLHAHWLVDSRWVDAKALSVTWGNLVGQSFAIVKVLDVRGQNYTHEVCKYLAKGSEIASWPAEQIVEFVSAIRGRRFFFAFGSLFKMGRTIRATIAAQAPPPPVCDCGSSKFLFEDETQAVLHELRNQKRK